MLLLLLHAMRVSFPLIRDQDTIRSVPPSISTRELMSERQDLEVQRRA